MQPEVEKKCFVSDIIASELVLLNCLYSEQDTFQRHPMCKQAVGRLCMSIRDTIANSIELAVINEYDKRAVK